MNTYDWATIRANAISRFGGDAPRAELEQRILNIFQQQPQLVVLAIDKIAASYTAGSVRSPWAVLATHIERAAAPGADLVVDDTTLRLKRIQQAEQWIRAAGMHFDREDEILLELFDGGRLSAYAQTSLISTEPDGGPPWMLAPITGDTALAERMLDLWREHRPTGIMLEQEAQERADTWKRQQTARAEALAAAKTELEDTCLNASTLTTPERASASTEARAESPPSGITTSSSRSSTSPKPPAESSLSTSLDSGTATAPTSASENSTNSPNESAASPEPALATTHHDDDLPL